MWSCTITNLDGTGYPNGLRGDQISDIVRLTRSWIYMRRW